MALQRANSIRGSYKSHLPFSVLQSPEVFMERPRLSTDEWTAERSHMPLQKYSKPAFKRTYYAEEPRKTSGKKKWRVRFIKWIINTRCTENSIWASSATIGLITLCLQGIPMFLLDWVHITEPHPINMIDEKGDPVEVQFTYNAGYFQMCRTLTANLSALGIIEDEPVHMENPEICVENSIYTGKDLSDFSFATNAILVRLTIPTVLHLAGTLLTGFAFMLSFVGYWKKSSKTLCSAIFYVLGGLAVLIGMLQMICIVDDEMYPRMKPNSAGEPSVFSFKYGYSLMAAALSFLPIQICVYLQTSAYFNRFPKPHQKAIAVPGLSELLQQVAIIRSRSHQLGRLPSVTTPSLICGSGSSANSGVSVNFAARRRESRTSKDFGVFGIQQEVRNVVPPLTESFVRRPSAQLVL
ncbi:voltage-dependent calcium channel gamma-7 subunit [Ditylenchus destructor]|uniref:Voltage-dependent calcium channel gamma-7 subunit n=1 Tax=Ditylenchus destructor TaxID=166010 RepID=A0AAD4RC72_9BILA|nr:voltage-dependent calcium channel gamma-7 subunit [Ditylenchus destructor]